MSRPATAGMTAWRTKPVPNVKKIATWLVIAFIAFTIISSPDKAAEMTHTAFGGIASAGRAMGEFFSALTSS